MLPTRALFYMLNLINCCKSLTIYSSILVISCVMLFEAMLTLRTDSSSNFFLASQMIAFVIIANC